MSFRKVFFIKFVLYLPEWADGDKNLLSTLGLKANCKDFRKVMSKANNNGSSYTEWPKKNATAETRNSTTTY